MGNDMSGQIIRACPLCVSSDRVLTQYGNEQWPIVSCAACGFVYMPVVPNYVDMSSDYAWEKSSQEHTARRIEKMKLRKAISVRFQNIKKRLLKRDKLRSLLFQYLLGGSIVDIGCGSGSFLQSLPVKYVTYGIEISEASAEKATTNLACRQGVIIHDHAVSGLAKLPEDFFDAVIMSAFLEHEIAPLTVLQKALKVLKQGGLVIIKVPNYRSGLRYLCQNNWCGFRLPDHVNYFTPKSLVDISFKAGFKIKRFALFDHPFFSDNMWIVLEK